MILSQQLRVNSFDHHLQFRVKNKKKLRRVLVAGLTLTSMVDMFSLLVIFLLQSFSASPELVMVSKGVTLPSASTGSEMKDAPVLSLSDDGVYLDQKFVGKTEELLHNPGPLMTKLEELRVKWQKSHPNAAFNGEINLQAHRELSSSLVAQFMGMLPSQNYSSIQLAVVAGGRVGR